MNNNKKKLQFLPFNAINEFMRTDFQVDVIRETFRALPDLPGEYQNTIENLTKKYVKIPGFRDSRKAPFVIRLKPTLDAFEKHPEVTAAILSAWSEAHRDLRQQVFDLLSNRDWKVLPIEADRTKLPGFMVVWPKDQDFEVLFDAYRENFPDSTNGQDDVSLMVVWISNRLPYQIEEDSIGSDDELPSENSG